MAVKQSCSPYKKGKIEDSAGTLPVDVLLSRLTIDTVVVFSSDEGFIEFSKDILTKQGFALLAVNSPARLAEHCSEGYLNFLVDCDRLGLLDARSVTTSIRARASSSFIVAYCPATGWGSRLMEAGASDVIDGKGDPALYLMEASTGFLENIDAIISQHLRSTRRKIKGAAIRTRIEKATAKVVHLSLKHMLETDANVRAFLTNSWPPSRHGQYVAIADGETIGFANDVVKLAEQIRDFRPSGNILIQQIDCESDSLRQYFT